MATRRLAGILGLATTIGILVANALQPASGIDPGAPAADWGRWLADHPLTTWDWTLFYAEIFVLCLYLLFYPALWAVLRRAQGDWNWLAVAALGAGLASTTVKLASLPIGIVAYDRNDSLSADVQTALIESNEWSFVLTWAIDGVLLLSVGVLVVASRVLPRWLGWLALVCGVLSLASVTGGLNGFPGILLFFLWTVIASVYLIVRPHPDPA